MYQQKKLINLLHVDYNMSCSASFANMDNLGPTDEAWIHLFEDFLTSVFFHYNLSQKYMKKLFSFP